MGGAKIGIFPEKKKKNPTSRGKGVQRTVDTTGSLSMAGTW